MLMPHRGYLASYPLPVVGTPRDARPITRASEPVSSSDEGASTSSARWTSALLEELIYERVRLNVDLLELVDFERDLAESIERALAACGAEEDRERLASEYLERAWTRLERDWRAARESDDHLQCPLCGELASDGP
jgi:hypothetical protein